MFEFLNDEQQLLVDLLPEIRVNVYQVAPFDTFFLRVIDQNTVVGINLKQGGQFMQVLDTSNFLTLFSLNIPITKLLIKYATTLRHSQALELIDVLDAVLAHHIGPKTVVDVIEMKEVDELGEMWAWVEVVATDFGVVTHREGGLAFEEESLVEVEGDKNVFELFHQRFYYF